MGFQPTALVLSASVCSWPLGFVIAVSGTLRHSCPIQTFTAPISWMRKAGCRGSSGHCKQEGPGCPALALIEACLNSLS